MWDRTLILVSTLNSDRTLIWYRAALIWDRTLFWDKTLISDKNLISSKNDILNIFIILPWVLVLQNVPVPHELKREEIIGIICDR